MLGFAVTIDGRIVKKIVMKQKNNEKLF